MRTGRKTVRQVKRPIASEPKKKRVGEEGLRPGPRMWVRV